MWSILAPLVNPLLEGVLKLIPDSNERARAKEKLEYDLMMAVNVASEAQTKINMAEARHRSIFVAGWRPGVGWVCAFGLFYATIGAPLISYYIAIAHPELPPLPELNTEALMTVLLGMLGFGGLRTFEKTKGLTR